MATLPRGFSKLGVFSLLVGVGSIYWFSFLEQLLDFFFPEPKDARLWQSFEFHVHGRGYKSETHRIRTVDGYEIEFHRLWNPNVTRQSYPVAFVPLNFATSKTRVMFDNSPAYSFADAGFDVWLMNHRGSSYGLKHAWLTDRTALYNFTLIDFGEIDVPQQIDHILRDTGHPKIFLVTCSQATMAFFAMLSRKPQYQEKIAKAIAYGGAKTPCYLKHVLEIKLFELFGDFIYHGSTPHNGQLGRLVSRFPFFTQFIDSFAGLGHASLNESQIPLLMEHRTEGTSMKQFMHMSQNARTNCDGELRDFDYDFGMTTRLLIWLGLRASRNMEAYGAPEPPVLRLDHISFPMKFYFSDGDALITREAVTRLAEKMKIPAHDVHRIADERIHHSNFEIFSGRMHHIHHAIDFFKGNESTWNPHIFNEPSHC